MSLNANGIRGPRQRSPAPTFNPCNEQIDFGVARRQQEGLGLSLVSGAPRSRAGQGPPGFVAPNARSPLQVVDLMEK